MSNFLEPNQLQRRTTTTRHPISIRAVLLALGAILAWQLFVPPSVGLADNGDFPRLMGRFDLGHPTAAYEEQYFHHFIARYRIGAQYRWMEGLPSSEAVLIFSAVQLNRLIEKREGWFDIRLLGLVHASLFVLAAGALLRFTAPLGKLARAVLAGGLLLIFADVGYVAYFNSFYSEPATFLFLLFALATLIRLLGPGGLTLRWLALHALALCLFACAKPQNAPIALLLTAFLAYVSRLRPDRSWARGCWVAVVAICLILASYLRATERTLGRIYPYVSVFMVLLPYSPSPETDLAELGFDPALVRYAGVSPFSAEAPLGQEVFDAEYTEHFSTARLLLLYLRHPGRTLAALGRCAPRALLLRPSLGNFERSSGAPPDAKSRAFSTWSRLRSRFGPKTAQGLFGGLVLWALGLALARSRSSNPRLRLALDWLLLCLGMAASEYMLVALTAGPLDTAKHMHVFSLLLDVALVASAMLVAWRASPALDGLADATQGPAAATSSR